MSRGKKSHQTLREFLLTSSAVPDSIVAMAKLPFSPTDFDYNFNLVGNALDQGGLTVNYFTGETPESGVAVSLLGAEVRVPATWALSELRFALSFYLCVTLPEGIDIREKLRAGYYLGMWVSEGFLYFDLTEIVPTVEEALKLGRARNQVAVYDIGKGEEVKC